MSHVECHFKYTYHALGLGLQRVLKVHLFSLQLLYLNDEVLCILPLPRALSHV